MAHDVSKFTVGEIINGDGIGVKILSVCKISGQLIAEKIWIFVITESECKKIYWNIRSRPRVIFVPQDRFANSWISLPPQPPYVLCLRSDGIKVLG